MPLGLLFRYVGWGLLLGISLWAYEAEQPKATGISCRSAYELGQWSLQKSPSGKNLSFSNPSFAAQALERYLEFADPHKLLFLQPEVEAFKKSQIAAWNTFIEKQRCEALSTSLLTHYASAKARLLKKIASSPLEEYVPEKLVAGDPAEKDLPSFATFAKDEQDLSKRIAKYAASIGESANQDQLALFEGNRRKLVEFAILRTLFAEAPPSPLHLLARAVVNTVDPFSDYFSQAEFTDFYRDLTGGTSGVGVKVREVPQGLLVLKVLPHSPAGRAGTLHAGDTIIEVDGRPLSKVRPSEWRHILEGPELSSIRLTLKPRKSSVPKQVELTRRSFAFEDARVEWRSLRVGSARGRVAVIAIPSFYGRGGIGLLGERSSAEDVEKAIREALKTKPRAVVLDLRGNPGGYLEEAVAMAGLFLGNRPVVAVVEPHSKRILKDARRKALYEGPLLLLMDEQSASASEVLAGALKDYQRAVVLGAKRSFGKGSVQRLFHLDTGTVDLTDTANGVLKLTTSFFYSPLGHSPAEGGIPADITLNLPKQTEEKPKRRQKAPAEGPFVDGLTLRAIHLREGTMRSRIAALKQSHAVRSADVKAVFKRAVERAFDLRADRGSQPLAETLAIASDLLELERRRGAAHPVSGGRTALKPVSPEHAQKKSETPAWVW